MSDDIQLVVATGAFTLGGALLVAIFGFFANRHVVRAGAKERASGRSIDACLNFTAVSFHYFTAQHEYINRLARIKAASPDEPQPARLLNHVEMKRTLGSLRQKSFRAAVRAESFTPTKRIFDLVYAMQICQSDIKELLNLAIQGNLPDNWETQLQRHADKHDRVGQEMTELLRQYGARHSYLDSFPGRASKPSDSA